jgi:hypothetical protein
MAPARGDFIAVTEIACVIFSTLSRSYPLLTSPITTVWVSVVLGFRFKKKIFISENFIGIPILESLYYLNQCCIHHSFFVSLHFDL